MDEFEQMNEIEAKADAMATEPLQPFGKNKKPCLVTLISTLAFGIIGGILWLVLGKTILGI